MELLRPDPEVLKNKPFETNICSLPKAVYLECFRNNNVINITDNLVIAISISPNSNRS